MPKKEQRSLGSGGVRRIGEADEKPLCNPATIRSLLENLANTSSAVMGGLLADTVRRTAQMRGKGSKGGGGRKVKANQASANKDPKYIEDLSRGLSHAAAFTRHRSRLRTVQHQVEHGNVTLQPRATPLQTVRLLPPMLSLGKSHRLYLLNRLDQLERRGVTWTQEESGQPGRCSILNIGDSLKVIGCTTLFNQDRGNKEHLHNAGSSGLVRGYHQERRDPGDPKCGYKSVWCTTPSCIPRDALFYQAMLLCLTYYHR
ncbi:unnamed protein product [Symbiodinium sp. KB8]|nr:unnamed protein product [Symbiodinium sp. KB8]